MKVLFAVAAAVASIAPAVAQAQTAPVGAYANLGYALVDTGPEDFNAIGARVGYRFNEWVGVEGEGALGVGDEDYATPVGPVSVKLKHQFAGYAVGFWPVSPQADLLARIGYGTTKFKVTADGFTTSSSDESWNLGVGGQYHFDGLNGVRAEYTRQKFDDGGGHANVWSIAYSRRF